MPVAMPPLDGNNAAAESLIKMFWLLMAVPPPASDQNARLVPSGPTNRKSRSAGNVCDSPVRVMVSVLTRAHRPKVVNRMTAKPL